MTTSQAQATIQGNEKGDTKRDTKDDTDDAAFAKYTDLLLKSCLVVDAAQLQNLFERGIHRFGFARMEPMLVELTKDEQCKAACVVLADARMCQLQGTDPDVHVGLPSWLSLVMSGHALLKNDADRHDLPSHWEKAAKELHVVPAVFGLAHRRILEDKVKEIAEAEVKAEEEKKAKVAERARHFVLADAESRRLMSREYAQAIKRCAAVTGHTEQEIDDMRWQFDAKTNRWWSPDHEAEFWFTSAGEGEPVGWSRASISAASGRDFSPFKPNVKRVVSKRSSFGWGWFGW